MQGQSAISPVQLSDEYAMKFPFHVIDLYYQANERSKHATFHNCDNVKNPHTYMADLR